MGWRVGWGVRGVDGGAESWHRVLLNDTRKHKAPNSTIQYNTVQTSTSADALGSPLPSPTAVFC